MAAEPQLQQSVTSGKQLGRQMAQGIVGADPEEAPQMISFGVIFFPRKTGQILFFIHIVSFSRMLAHFEVIG